MAKVVPGSWTLANSVLPVGREAGAGELLVAQPVLRQRERAAAGRDAGQELAVVVAVGAHDRVAERRDRDVVRALEVVGRVEHHHQLQPVPAGVVAPDLPAVDGGRDVLLVLGVGAPAVGRDEPDRPAADPHALGLGDGRAGVELAQRLALRRVGDVHRDPLQRAEHRARLGHRRQVGPGQVGDPQRVQRPPAPQPPPAAAVGPEPVHLAERGVGVLGQVRDARRVERHRLVLEAAEPDQRRRVAARRRGRPRTRSRA